jgi:hypothetical protein
MGNFDFGRPAVVAVALAAPRADEPGSGRVSSARSQHKPAKTGVSAVMSSDALCARTIKLPRWPLAALASTALALAGCATSTSQQEPQPVALPQPEIPARVRATEIVGRWGYAAYHKPEDRARTEANARGQCKQPFVIGQGPTGGVMMYLAESSQLQELRLKGSQGGRDYIGPAGETPGQQDREIVTFDGRVLLLKYVDPEIDGRYGTGVFVRCAPRA